MTHVLNSKNNVYTLNITHMSLKFIELYEALHQNLQFFALFILLIVNMRLHLSKNP